MTNYKVINIKFTENPCNRYFFEEDKCLYSLNREKRGRKYLNCIEHECKCKSKIEGDLMMRTNPRIFHVHANHQFVAEFEICYDKLKNDVDTTTTSARDLHKSAIRQMSREAAGLMSWENVRGTLNRIRRSKMPACHNIEELDELLNNNQLVYETYGKIRGKSFFNGSIHGQMVFSHPELIPELGPNFEIFVDGTFKVVPHHQTQLLVVMATICGKPRPIIYAIMNELTEEMYTSVFEFIRDAVLPANKCPYSPKSATMDFEMGMRNAVKNVWMDINVFGCNFHYCQALRRNAMDFLQDRIENSPKHKEILLMLMRSSLLPLDMLHDGINAIKSFIENDPVLSEDFKYFMEYFDFTWKERYPPEEWCVSGQKYRTNNHIEGYNNKIKKWIPLNPSPWKFLDALQDLAYDADSDLENAKSKGIIYKDVSRLTPHLNELLPQLEEGIIDELEFMSKMACV